MEQNDLPMGAIVGSSDTINSSTPMERTLLQLVIIMQEITNECKEGSVTLCEHATSPRKYWHVIFMTYVSQKQMQFYT